MQEPDMPDPVKNFFEMHKAGINLFLVIMNVLVFQGSECKDVLFGKKKLKDITCWKSR